MKYIQRMCFNGCSEEAIYFYQKAFGAEIHTLLHYRDAVEYGWEPPCPEKADQLYHCEIYFGDTEVRFEDVEGEPSEITQKTEHLIGMDTAEEVKRAFSILEDGGEVIRELESPPFMVIIGSVRDRFGVLWTLMCDYK